MQPGSSSMPDTAVTLLEQQLARARERGDTREIIDALSQLGKAWMAEGSTPRGLTQIEEAIKLAEANSETELEARLWGHKAEALRQLGNFKLAMHALNKAQRLAKAIAHKTLECDALIQIGLIFLEQRQVEKAISRLEQAFALTMQSDDRQRRLFTSARLGDAFLSIGSLEKAADYFGTAMVNAQALGNRVAESAALVSLGNVLLANDEYQDAVEHFENALNLAAEADDSGTELAALTGLTRAHARLGKLRLATMYGEQAIRTAHDRAQYEHELQYVQLLATTLANHDQHAAAQRQFAYGLSVVEQHGLEHWRASMLGGLGATAYAQDDLPAAAAHFTAALDLVALAGESEQQLALLAQLGAVQADMGATDQAIDTTKRALQLAHDVADSHMVAQQQFMLAMAFYDAGERDQARRYCADAISGFEALGNTAMLEQALALGASLDQ